MYFKINFTYSTQIVFTLQNTNMQTFKNDLLVFKVFQLL